MFPGSELKLKARLRYERYRSDNDKNQLPHSLRASRRGRGGKPQLPPAAPERRGAARALVVLPPCGTQRWGASVAHFMESASYHCASLQTLCDVSSSVLVWAEMQALGVEVWS